MMEDLLLSHTSTSTRCSHGCINPVEQQKSVDTSKGLFTPHSRMVEVFHCDNINETLCSGESGTGSKQLHYLGEDWNMVSWGNRGGRGEGVNFCFWVVGGELHHLAGMPGGRGESVFVILQSE